MNLAIVGSRNFEAYEYMCLEIESTIDISQVTSIISGGAAGADFMAEKFAEEKEIKIVIFPADWDKFGKSAGYIRNEDIIQSADVVLAFWDGKSK
jgi:predicted Rossmann fold nucleotide-binding protein DprA/Smf involved in DNA uptake